MSTILVTGAGGFIGSHLTEYLVKQGHKVKAFVRYNSRNFWGWLEKSKYIDDIEIYSGDIRDYDSVYESMKGIDYVFHLAALIGIPYSYYSPLAYVKTNIEGTYNILQSARELGTKRIIHTSTSEVYGTAQYIPITGHQTHQKIVDEIIKIKPSLVFHTGDLVEDGLIPAQWVTFNNIVSDLTNIAEFYPALGNHENDLQLYFDNFDLPHNERWYFVEKDILHFIVLDSNSDCSIGSEQYLWLKNDLQNINENIKFVIAIFHHPPFSIGPHDEDEKDLRQNIVPLFEQYGVDIVFSGHDHDYERSLYNWKW